jgi:hypothetical protein
MTGILNQYLAGDHDRLDGLLQKALAQPGQIDQGPFREFRKGLLRHIAMEEKVVLPEIARRQSGTPSPVADRLRLDHGALAALLVPSPTPSTVATLLSILKVHNALEEQDGGLYQVLDSIVGSEADVVLARLKSTPDVPVMPFNANPSVLDSTRRAVERAGYTMVGN